MIEDLTSNAAYNFHDEFERARFKVPSSIHAPPINENFPLRLYKNYIRYIRCILFTIVRSVDKDEQLIRQSAVVTKNVTCKNDVVLLRMCIVIVTQRR